MFCLPFFFTLFSGVTLGSLPPPERPYKIMILVAISPRSHRNVFVPLGNALAERGHEVSMLSNYPLQKSKFKHYELKMRHHPCMEAYNDTNLNMFEKSKSDLLLLSHLLDGFSRVAKLTYKEELVQDLYKRRDEFDLFIIDGLFNEMFYPFLHNKTFITVNTEGLAFRPSAVIGNFLNPAYAVNHFYNFQMPASFLNRVMNILHSIVEPIVWYFVITRAQQVEISKMFPDLPSLPAIEANQSLVLLNSHFSYGEVVPLLPNQVEIGCMHCRPAQPLPAELENFLSGDTPVVYMSLGSIARSTTIPSQYKKTILQTFSKLPYKLLWKYENDSLETLPDNVMIRHWMPQQDILGHKNVKVFVSHCGLLGSQEAMYHATPMVAMPIFGDQKKNAIRWSSLEIATVLHWKDLTESRFANAINEVMHNKIYSEKISAVSAAFKDQLQSPLERAVYWTEYVARHQGALHLRSPELNYSWVELLHLDILFLVHFGLFSLLLFTWKFAGNYSRKQKTD